jgi:hypothetical protein
MRAPRVVASKPLSEYQRRGGAAVADDCPQVAAMDRQAAQISRLADELKLARETISPAVEAITNLDAAQKKLCGFVVRHRVKILLSIPLVLTGVGAVSPAAADWLRAALRIWGVH